jgi:hypothetical protein
MKNALLMSINLSWTFLTGFLTLNISLSPFAIIIISGLAENWSLAIRRNALGSNYESTFAISATGKFAALTIKSAAPSNIRLTTLNLGTESFSRHYHHAIDSC